MKKIKINLYKKAKTLILLYTKIAFVDSINDRFGFWFNNEIKIFGNLTKWTVDFTQQVNFIMITFNYSWQFEEFIESLDKNIYDIKEFE